MKIWTQMQMVVFLSFQIGCKFLTLPFDCSLLYLTLVAWPKSSNSMTRIISKDSHAILREQHTFERQRQRQRQQQVFLGLSSSCQIFARNGYLIEKRRRIRRRAKWKSDWKVKKVSPSWRWLEFRQTIDYGTENNIVCWISLPKKVTNL